MRAAIEREITIEQLEFVWAALDRPTGWACELSGGPIVLGRLTARIDQPVRPGQQHIITAWRLGQDGRKQHSGCTISTTDGELLALSQALWIAPQNPTAFRAMTASADSALSRSSRLTRSGR
jgi:hypothetical protein